MCTNTYLDDHDYVRFFRFASLCFCFPYSSAFFFFNPRFIIPDPNNFCHNLCLSNFFFFFFPFGLVILGFYFFFIFDRVHLRGNVAVFLDSFFIYLFIRFFVSLDLDIFFCFHLFALIWPVLFVLRFAFHMRFGSSFHAREDIATPLFDFFVFLFRLRFVWPGQLLFSFVCNNFIFSGLSTRFCVLFWIRSSRKCVKSLFWSIFSISFTYVRSFF